MTNNSRKSEAYAEGRDAWRDNETLLENPCLVDSDDWEAWRNGWQDADFDAWEVERSTDAKFDALRTALG